MWKVHRDDLYHYGHDCMILAGQLVCPNIRDDNCQQQQEYTLRQLKSHFSVYDQDIWNYDDGVVYRLTGKQQKQQEAMCQCITTSPAALSWGPAQQQHYPSILESASHQHPPYLESAQKQQQLPVEQPSLPESVQQQEQSVQQLIQESVQQEQVALQPPTQESQQTSNYKSCDQSVQNNSASGTERQKENIPSNVSICHHYHNEASSPFTSTASEEFTVAICYGNDSCLNTHFKVKPSTRMSKMFENIPYAKYGIQYPEDAEFYLSRRVRSGREQPLAKRDPIRPNQTAADLNLEDGDEINIVLVSNLADDDVDDSGSDGESSQRDVVVNSDKNEEDKTYSDSLEEQEQEQPQMKERHKEQMKMSDKITVAFDQVEKAAVFYQAPIGDSQSNEPCQEVEVIVLEDEGDMESYLADAVDACTNVGTLTVKLPPCLDTPSAKERGRTRKATCESFEDSKVPTKVEWVEEAQFLEENLYKKAQERIRPRKSTKPASPELKVSAAFEHKALVVSEEITEENDDDVSVEVVTEKSKVNMAAASGFRKKPPVGRKRKQDSSKIFPRCRQRPTNASKRKQDGVDATLKGPF